MCLFSSNGKELREKFDIEIWIKDTEDLSIAHLKELFVSLVILGKGYEESVTRLKSMKDHLDGAHNNRDLGFSNDESEEA